MRETFYIATTGRRGPVLVDLPKDVTSSKAEFTWPEVKIRSYNPTYEGNKWMIGQAAEMIAKSKKSLIIAGGGVILSGAHKELKELAEITSTPVTMTLMGLGGFPGTHTLSLGMPGMHGTYYANKAIQESDLLIAIGTRFDDRVTGKLDSFAPHAKIIHIDIDPTSIKKNVLEIFPMFIVKPELDRRDFADLRKYCLGLDLNFIGFSVLTPLPGTDLYDDVKEKLINFNYDYFDFFHTLLPTTLPIRDFYSELIKLYNGSRSMKNQIKLMRKYRLRELLSLFRIYGDFIKRLKTLAQDYTANSM